MAHLIIVKRRPKNSLRRTSDWTSRAHPFSYSLFSFFLLSFGSLKCRVPCKWIFASLSPTRAKHLCYKRCFLYLVPKPKTLRQFYCLHSVVFNSKIEEINKEVKILWIKPEVLYYNKFQCITEQLDVLSSEQTTWG